MTGQYWEHNNRYFNVYFLLAVSMIVIVIGGDYLISNYLRWNISQSI